MASGLPEPNNEGRAKLAAEPIQNDRGERPSDAMARVVERFDWASTPLGPRKSWPPELKVIVQQILDSHFPKAVVWGPDYTTIYNDAFRPILGNKREALGRSFADIWSDVWDSIGPIAERAYAGTATYIEDFPLSVDRSGQTEQAWFTFCYSPLRLSDGSVVGMLDTVIETTATVRTRADMSVANQELGHRLKNTLALVQAIATQTLKGVTEKESVAAFGERLGALGRAHDVLLRQDWSAVSLPQTVEESLRPHDGFGQVRMAGPDIQIGSRATMTLSLILHELATNALKYGALSVPRGCVDVSWTVEQDAIEFRWHERNGPQVKEPAHEGFGTRLVDRGFGSQTRVARSYDPAGFDIRLEAPLSEIRD